MGSTVKQIILDIAIDLSVTLVKTLDRYIIYAKTDKPYIKNVRNDAVDICTTLLILKAEEEGEQIDDNKVSFMLALHGISSK